jgi:hypothetical protein
VARRWVYSGPADRLLGYAQLTPISPSGDLDGETPAPSGGRWNRDPAIDVLLWLGRQLAFW